MNDCRTMETIISITFEGSAQLKKSMQDRNKKNKQDHLKIFH